MYGTRDAAANWEEFSAGVARGAGFEIGQANPCLMWHPGQTVRCFKLGEDFVLGGRRDNVRLARDC
eukprot:4161198-Prorocentrum_lima.AAC.1